MKKPELAKVAPIAPRLLDVAGAALYLSVGSQTIRDWEADCLIEAVPVPGASLRKDGRVLAGPRQRRMAKLLFDIRDLDSFIDRLKRDGGS